MSMKLALLLAVVGSLVLTATASATPATRACGPTFAFTGTPSGQGRVWVRGPVTCTFAKRVIGAADDKMDATDRLDALVTVSGHGMRCRILMGANGQQPPGYTDENYPIMLCTGANGRRVGLYA
jgi:hypothetical protein